jgi:putative YphP/YqiW family bacilliredoxin
LRTSAEVVDFFEDRQGTALLMVNSVCGCAAGTARPAVRLALNHGQRPERAATVFAGQDLEATESARGLIGDVPPSSPSIALMKDGELVHFVPRHLIEGRQADAIAADLVKAFTAYCS